MTYVRRNLVPLLVAVVALVVAAASVAMIADRVHEWRGDRYEGRWGHHAGDDHDRWMSDTHGGMHGGGAGRHDGSARPGSMPYGGNPGAGGPLLGVTVETAKDGVRVASVQAGSAAASAGVQTGDVLTQVDDQALHSAADVRAALAAADGDSVRLTVQRGGKMQQLTAHLDRGGTAGALPQPGVRRGMQALPGGMPAPGRSAQPAQPGQSQPGQQPFSGFTLGPEMQQMLQQLVQRLLPLLLEAFRSGSLGAQGSGGGLFGLMPAPGGRSAPALPATPGVTTPGTTTPGTVAYWGTVRALDARSITLDGALGPVTLQVTPQTVIVGAVAPHVGGTVTVVAAGSVTQTIAVID